MTNEICINDIKINIAKLVENIKNKCNYSYLLKELSENYNYYDVENNMI